MINLTDNQLMGICPLLPTEKRTLFLPFLNASTAEWNIATPERLCHFMAQIAFESNQLRNWAELSDGEQYNGRLDIGNTYPGDGPRFKGRSPIMLTGRSGYAAVTAALNVNFLDQPELLEQPEYGFQVAGWYWSARHLNSMADKGVGEDQLKNITTRINGGLNGLDNRRRFLQKAIEVIMVCEEPIKELIKGA